MLLVEHIVLFDTLDRPDAYAVGTTTLLSGLTGYALLTPNSHVREAVAAAWGIAFICGATMKVAYWARAALERRDRLATQAGVIAGMSLRKGGCDGTHTAESAHRAHRDAGVGSG